VELDPDKIKIVTVEKDDYIVALGDPNMWDTREDVEEELIITLENEAGDVIDTIGVVVDYD